MLVRRWGGEAGMEEEIENGKGRQSGGEEEKGGDGNGWQPRRSQKGAEWLLASDIAKRDEES